MELDVFAGQEKSELSMIEVARAILETRGRDKEMYFNDLVNEIQNYLEKSDADIRSSHWKILMKMHQNVKTRK